MGGGEEEEEEEKEGEEEWDEESAASGCGEDLQTMTDVSRRTDSVETFDGTG
jgi:hypothetical protein